MLLKYKKISTTIQALISLSYSFRLRNFLIIVYILISIIISMTFTFEINCFIFPIDLVIFNSYNSILSLLIFLFSFYIFYRKDINTKKVKKVCSLLIAILLLIGEVYGKYSKR